MIIIIIYLIIIMMMNHYGPTVGADGADTESHTLQLCSLLL